MLPYFKEDNLEVGLDEAGRGTLIGDVYAAAVILPPEISFLVNDSKKLTRRRRLILKDCIEEEAIDFAVANNGPQRIDKINILNASIESMHKALRELNVEPEYILVDGDRFKPYYNETGQFIPHKCIIEGDATYNSIAAASILAKVYHDKHIEKLCDEYPELDDHYHLRNNMGYGTKLHIDGIQEYGITQFHRKTYKTCQNQDLNYSNHI